MKLRAKTKTRDDETNETDERTETNWARKLVFFCICSAAYISLRPCMLRVKRGKPGLLEFARMWWKGSGCATERCRSVLVDSTPRLCRCVTKFMIIGHLLGLQTGVYLWVYRWSKCNTGGTYRNINASKNAFVVISSRVLRSNGTAPI